MAYKEGPWVCQDSCWWEPSMQLIFIAREAEPSLGNGDSSRMTHFTALMALVMQQLLFGTSIDVSLNACLVSPQTSSSSHMASWQLYMPYLQDIFISGISSMTLSLIHKSAIHTRPIYWTSQVQSRHIFSKNVLFAECWRAKVMAVWCLLQKGEVCNVPSHTKWCSL